MFDLAILPLSTNSVWPPATSVVVESHKIKTRLDALRQLTMKIALFAVYK